MPVYDFTWVTDAPIQPVKPAANVKEIAKRLKANIEDWQKGYVPPDPRIPGIPSEAQLEGSLTMCDVISPDYKEYKFSAPYVYNFCGAPVGIIILDEDYEDHIYVDDLVTHPAAEFAGSIMIEFALNRALQLGRAAALTLWPLNENSVAGYTGMGFDKTSDGHMVLRPETKKDKWQKLNQKWSYLSGRPMGPLYLKTTRPPPPIPPKPNFSKPLPPIPPPKS